MDEERRARALALLLKAPQRTALLTDFDGTLSPIVDDPESAVALEGAAVVLGRLARCFGAVAVVSGRPVSFLARQLAAAGAEVKLFGVYGLEEMHDGELRVAPAAAAWLEPAAVVVAAAQREAPAGVGVEAKGAALAIHWRRAPGAGVWASEFAEQWAERTGLVVQRGRLALDMRPPIAIDKGQVVEAVARECAAACFIGDDAGDLPAFAALDRLGQAGMRVVKVAVADEESPAELVAQADLVLSGPVDALALLEQLARGAVGAEKKDDG